MDEDVDLQIQGLRQAIEKEEQWLESPAIKSILSNLTAQEEAHVELVCSRDIVDVATFFAHFSACGLLEGVRHAKRLITARRDDLKDKLEYLESHAN